MVIPGLPGCGLDASAAFCDSFDAPAAAHGRAGELDPLKWSGARSAPTMPSSNGLAMGISAATIPSCRAGIASKVWPDGDTLICDPNAGIANNHLLVAVAAQYYGQNSYRIRQPFDFAGRTGKIVFDAEGNNIPLLGWVSLEISEDPTPHPSFTMPQTGNDEGSVTPRSALEIQFQDKCDGYSTVPAVGVRVLITYKDYVGTFQMPTLHPCPTTKAGSLNHFEVSVSQSRVEVYGTNHSSDGATFGEKKLMLSAAIDLPFSRGYVSITTHNHATLKYSEGQAMDAWIARWDNVGFDGPVLANFREYEVPDSLTKATPEGSTASVTNIGYRVADAAEGPSSTLHLNGVDTSGMKTARIALAAWYLVSEKTAQYVLRYRLNGGAWHDRPLNAGEAKLINGMSTGGSFGSQGQIGQMLDVPLSELVSGDNTLEFVTKDVPQNYPPVISNIDLILSK